MSTKSRIIEILEENRNEYISGQELAQRLGVSRNAVWKTIKSLEEQGHKISAVPNRGYKLELGSDLLSREGVILALPKQWQNCEIFVYDCLDSTNSVAKKMALEGAPHATIVLAEEQTHGRGRSGKSFYSPAKTGLYMSLLLRPSRPLAKPQMLTVAAAVSVCRAIEKLTGLSAQIKWVNDLILENKKICGISTEAFTDFESGGIDHIVLGIGVNCTLNTELLPKELQDIAGALNVSGLSRNRLAAGIAAGVLEAIENLDSRDYIDEYKRRSMMAGKRIFFSRDNKKIGAVVLGIDDDCGLILKCDDGREIVLSSGEISIGSDYR